jgi:hypothetical protein
MRNNQRLKFQNTWKRFKNPILNRYTSPGAWETCLPGERNKYPNSWMRLLIYKPSLMIEKGNPS